MSESPTIMPGIELAKFFDGTENLQKEWFLISAIDALLLGSTYNILLKMSTRLSLANYGSSNYPFFMSL